MRHFGFCLLLLAFCLTARAAETNSIVWHKAADRVDADVRSLSLSNLLEQITAQTGWQVYVEPGATHSASAKFKNLPSGEALGMLFGNLNFALVPQTNAASRLYVFTTQMQNATQLVRVPKNKMARHVPNELLVKLHPGVNPNDFAKMFGAKIIGRMDKPGVYRLEFPDAAAADAALNRLQNNADVADVDYNYYFDPPPSAQALAASMPPVNLQLNPPGNSGRVIVGLIDTAVQPLDGSLNQFLLKQISVAGDAPANSADITHGTAMAETILRAISQASGGSTSAQILPVDVYGPNTSTTSWDVALGIQAAVNNGATVLNLSLGSSSDNPVLDTVIQQAAGDGILIFAAAGNQPVATPTYPAADPGVIAVTALAQNGQIAPYANYGNWVNLGFSGNSVVFLGSQAYLVQGTSVSTAIATGVAAGNESALGWNWTQIKSAMQQKFGVQK
jgi:hypothetical protein